MAYGNNNNRNYNNNGGYNQNNNNRQNQQPQYKKSGATYSKIRKGNAEGLIIVNAWRKTAQGLMTAKCTPYPDIDKSGNHTGYTIHKGKEKGHEFIRYKVEIVMNGQITKYYTLMRLDTKMIVIKELSLVISPNGSGYTASGKKVQGYFGANFKRK